MKKMGEIDKQITEIKSEQNFEVNKSVLFSDKGYREGDTITKKNLEGEVENQLTKQVNQYIQKAITFILGTVLGTLLILVWNLNGDIREMKGKSNSPDAVVQAINQRLEKLEDLNTKLMDKNFQLEIEKMKIELELSNLKKHNK